MLHPDGTYSLDDMLNEEEETDVRLSALELQTWLELDVFPVYVLQCVAVCCSVLQCVAVCCS